MTAWLKTEAAHSSSDWFHFRGTQISMCWGFPEMIVPFLSVDLVTAATCRIQGSGLSGLFAFFKGATFGLDLSCW